MSFILQPWTLLFVILAGWVNELQQQAIEYLRTDNQVLKEKLGTRRILLSYNQRRRPAVERTTLRRKRLEQIGTWVTPDTILGWQRFLVARKWHYSSRKKGRQGMDSSRRLPASSQSAKLTPIQRKNGGTRGLLELTNGDERSRTAENPLVQCALALYRVRRFFTVSRDP